MGFFRGLRYPFRGARMVFLRYPGMVVWWMPPILITMALVAMAAVSNLIFDWNRAPESHEPEPELSEEEIKSLKAQLKSK